MRLFWGIFLGSLSLNALAQRPRHAMPDVSVLRSQSPAITTPSPITGLLEIRPTLGTRKGNIGTENSYELSWWVNPRERLSFGGGIFTAPGADKSQSLSMGDGFLRYQWREFKRNEVTGLTATADARANLPLSRASREAGLITAIRSTFTLAMPITPSTRFEFRETPIIYIFKAPGHEGSSGSVAHPIIENRISLGPVFTLSPTLTLSTPLNFSLTKYRNYSAGASHNKELLPDLAFNPELDWQANTHLYLGLAYRTEAFIIRDQIGMVLNNTAGNGSFQFVLGLSF
ncbi:MAG: hypothetical protein EBQ92_07270 [Proteobacteria bacterium]|nr:hypothetical protein [Pseudomonadota bacterium]